MMVHYGQDNTPFFVVGCVRSGTTMLRNLLRLHPRLECPEETHFYRWADPYGSPRYDRNYITMKLFESHRKLDGISNKDFHAARFSANDRQEISEAYGKLYLQAVKNPEGRWFDKTPQNIYGIFLLARQFPDSKFIHIHRHPLNVVSSLAEGKVMAKHSIKGAVNYWLEAITLTEEFKKLYPERLFELPYEEITKQDTPVVKDLFEFLQEDFTCVNAQSIHPHLEKNKYKQILNDKDVAYVQSRTASFLTQYGYEPFPQG